MDGKSLLAGALLLWVAVLGFLFWDSQHNVAIRLPV